MMLLDNALLTQSHYMLMEPILLFFALSGLFCILKFRALERSGNAQGLSYSASWWGWLLSGAVLLTCSFWSVSYQLDSFLFGIHSYFVVDCAVSSMLASTRICSAWHW